MDGSDIFQLGMAGPGVEGNLDGPFTGKETIDPPAYVASPAKMF